MEIVESINLMTETLRTIIPIALGTAIGGGVLYVFVADYLRKRAEVNRRIWEDL